MIRLVVNAEDFGATPAINRGIMKAHQHGIVTSASMLGNCRDITAVRDFLVQAPRMGVGLSLALIGGDAISAGVHVPSLTTAGGRLRDSAAEFALDWWKQVIAPEHVERELDAQISRALAAGIVPDHLCTRGHLGFIPGVGEIVGRLARRHRIAGLRTTIDPPTLSWLTDPRRGVRTGVLAGLAWVTRRRLGALRHGPRTWGYVESGQLDEVRIMEIIGRLGPGAHELVCHPGPAAVGGDPRYSATQTAENTAVPPPTGTDLAAGTTADSTEMRALTSAKVKTALERRGIVLVRWRDLF